MLTKKIFLEASRSHEDNDGLTTEQSNLSIITLFWVMSSLLLLAMGLSFQEGWYEISNLFCEVIVTQSFVPSP